MKNLTAQTLALVAQGHLETLADLDAHGLIPGPGEAPEAFANRLDQLRANLAELQQDLSRDGHVDFFDTRLESNDRIPPKVFAEAGDTTRKLYGFAIDWVPGFYSNYRMGMLFAGCAYYAFDDFFALFIIRNSFRKRDRWLIYERRELLAHELCHIAHVGFQSRNYEELLAYQTSPAMLRRGLGGLLRTPFDTYLILGALFFVLAAQLGNIAVNPDPRWHSMPMPIVFALGFGAIAFVVLRYLVYLRRFRRARRLLSAVVGADNAGPILFRCADAELAALAGLPDADAAAQWLRSRPAGEWRWRVIVHRFAPDLDIPPSDREESTDEP